MKSRMEYNFQQVLDELAGVVRSGWTWPSPEVGFARHIFEQAAESLPAIDDHAEWPAAGRLDRAPILASTGYVLAGTGRVLRPEWQTAWAAGFERLSEREAFPADRMSFAFRPLYVLGIALGVANCPHVGDAGRDWMKGVMRRLIHDGSNDAWADLVYGMAAKTLGTGWRDRLFVQLDGAAPEVLGLLALAAHTRSAVGVGGPSDIKAVEGELVRRLMSGVQLPREVAKATVMYVSLRRALTALCAADAQKSPQNTSGGCGSFSFDPSILRNARTDAKLHFTFVAGDQHVGDQFNMRDNIAGAVGRGASLLAQDIKVYKSNVERAINFDPDLRQKLVQAGEEVERTSLSDPDKQDVVESLKKLAAELDKPNREPGLVKRYWNRVKEVAPTVASLLASAATIAKMVSGS